VNKTLRGLGVVAVSARRRFGIWSVILHRAVGGNLVGFNADFDKAMAEAVSRAAEVST
jgi:hypothetical protein